MPSAPVVVPFRTERSRKDVLVARLRAVASAGALDGDDVWAPTLRRALDESGPVFACFGDYLASRVDVLSVGECLALVQSRFMARRWSLMRVERLLAAEFGAAAPIDLVATPVTTTWCSQVHAARLRTGGLAHVEVLTLDRDAAHEDLNLLAEVHHACIGRVRDDVLTSMITDFCARFQEALDWRRRLSSVMAPTRKEDDVIVFPTVRTELCSPRVLVFDAPAPVYVSTLVGTDVAEAPVRILEAWLRQVMSGAVFPVLTADATVTAGVPFPVTIRLAQVPASSGARFVEYLLAVTDGLPDGAWTALSAELTPSQRAEPQAEVERAFRCLVPFRDDRTSGSGSESADQAFVQWRAATRRGWLPSAPLVSFYQGLFGLVSAVRDREPGRDVLSSAVARLRLEAGLHRFDEWANGHDVISAMERQMLLLLQLPQKVDQLLTAAAEGSVRVQLVSGDEHRVARQSRAAAVLGGALVLVAGLVLLASGVTSWSAGWSGSAQTVGLVAVGGLLVWAIGRVL
jgi:hypothetical protein